MATPILNGRLDDWSAADVIDRTGSVAGYDIYARASDGSYYFALKSPIAIGATTTAWLNTDQNSATGYQIWGFAGGAEYNVNFDATGIPRLYTGADGQTVVSSATVSYSYSADRTIVEFAVASSAIGSPGAIGTLWDVNDETFLATDYSLTQYTVFSADATPPAPPPGLAPVVGSVTLDGSLADWAAAEQVDQTLSFSGYDIYAKATGGSYVFALKAPVAIGATTTTWLNTDQNASTGYKIWGFAGGAEYNINFDASGTPRLYTGDAGQTLVAGATVTFGYSDDRTVVEFAVASSAIGSPSAINTLWDVNDETFLPTDYSATQYAVRGTSTPPPPGPGPAPAPSPVVGSISLDGRLIDWTASDLIDDTLSEAGYDIYAKGSGGSYAFAIKAPVPIGAGTTTWLNTDQNGATGYQIWGFAGGAEYNINFDANGTPRLYTGAGGQTLVNSPVAFGYSADRTIVEFAIATNALGTPAAINTLWDINDQTFLPTDYSATQYAVVNRAPASLTIDGSLGDWSAEDQIDKTLSTSGYDIYAKASGDAFVFAIKAPVAIGANTTVWLNTDQNAATGFKIFGSTGGAEYNINFDATGIPRLYTGDAGQALVPNVTVTHAYSADRTIVELSLQKSVIGNPLAINTLWDVNNSTFLPTDYATTQYPVVGAVPVRTDFNKKIGIVYSETTANQYFSKTAYSQLFMGAQNQAAMAGVPYDVLTESDLTNITRLANYDALLFPSFSHVQANQLTAIENTLKLAVQQYDIGLIASGNFMTSDQTGAALSGDSYARMKTLFGLQSIGGGFPANITIQAADVSHPMMSDYSPGELIRSYSGAGWQAFAPLTPASGNVLATQTVGTQTYNSVITTTTEGRNVHFSTPSVLADNNLLWQAIDYAVNGSGVTAGLQLSRNASIVASRTDVDQAFAPFVVKPPDGSLGSFDKLLPILQQWKTQYNFVGSYYIDIGDTPPGRTTAWQISGPYYAQILALGNELGSHSISHPFDTNTLTPTQIQYEFRQSKQMIEQRMSEILGRPFAVEGAAVPGAPETLSTALSILQYYDYLSGGYSSVGSGFPGAFGYLNPAMAAADKVYLAPNLKFDFSLVEFERLTSVQAAAEWARAVANQSSHAEVPVFVWPWHEYAAAEVQDEPGVASPYTTAMFTDFISRAYTAGAEFVTLVDLAQRISSFDRSAINWSVAGSTVTASVISSDVGRFALDLDHLGTQKIARVANWFAYDDDSVFLPRNGGTYTIGLGSTADDVTRIVSLPMRAELVSLTGNGTDLSLSLVGEGRIVVDLRNPSTLQYAVTGARAISITGERVELALDGIGLHNVGITQSGVNQAPVIYSSGGGATASISVAENTTAIALVAASDANIGQSVTYAVTGGADAARFTISAASGILTFVTAQDFEAPTDAGLDNVYNVTVTARDNLGVVDTQALAVTVTNVAGVTLTGDTGANTLTGGGEEDSLSGLGGNDTLSGLGGADVLLGGDGDDVLNGGAGADRMTGGAGNDTYHVDHIGDIVTEIAAGGTDFVLSALTYVLPAELENLTLTGFSAVDGTGNAVANTVQGNAAANTLSGGAGNDTLNGAAGNDVLIGGAGADTLTGGTGSDRFDYNAITEGVDMITDFVRGTSGDRLDIHDVLVGYGAGSNIDNFVRLTGTTSTLVSVNADGVGTDFAALATLQNVTMSASLLNEMLANGNLVV